MKICKLKSTSVCSSDSVISQIKLLFENSDGAPFIKNVYALNRSVTIFIAESYYYRTNSDLTITVIVEEQPEYTTVDVISSGGKVGVFQISYGAEDNAVKKVIKALQQLGFDEISA